MKEVERSGVDLSGRGLGTAVPRHVRVPHDLRRGAVSGGRPSARAQSI